MNIELRIIDASNRQTCLALRVAGEQPSFIASTRRSLEQAAEQPAVARPFAIYAEGTVVGFAMFAFDEDYEDPDDRYWLWRFMIDERFQRRGYGTAALGVIVAYFKENGANHIKLSTKPDNTTALSLYRRCGFRETGEQNGEEIVLRRSL